MQKETKELIKFFSKKYNIPQAEITKVFEAPFKFQTHVMKNVCDRKKLYFPSVRIPYFGIFYLPEWKKDKFRQKLQDEDNIKPSEE